MTNQEKDRICANIGASFLRVVKNHNYYLHFKTYFLKEQGLNPKMLPFDRHVVYMKSVARFSVIADKEYEAHRHEDSVYEYITIFINLMLRHYLEASGVDPRKLGMVGQELFDLSCYGIFGDKYFEDMERMSNAKGGMRAPRNEKEAWLMAEFEHRIRNGEKLDFERFMTERTNIPDDEFWNNTSNNAFLEAMREDHDNDDAYHDEDYDDNYEWDYDDEDGF